MYRTGIRQLSAEGARLAKQVYDRAYGVISKVIDSYVGYFGESEFVELVGYPRTFAALCVVGGLNEFSTASITATLAIIRDSTPLVSGLAVVGGESGRRFRLPEETEKTGFQLGLPISTIEYLKYCSRLVAKVDDAAVQDGYRLWFHAMVFSRDGTWSVVQIGSKSYLNRVYHWFSGRVKHRGFVDEPHTGLFSDAKAKYVLDFTLRSNDALRSSTLEVLKEPLSKLRACQRVFSLGGQSRLTDYYGQEEGQIVEVNPLTAPVKVNWALLEELSSVNMSGFEDLLAIRGVGAETLRFLALCARKLYGIEPLLDDRALEFSDLSRPVSEERVEELFYNLVEAVRYSSLNCELAKNIANRLKVWWTPLGRPN